MIYRITSITGCFLLGLFFLAGLMTVPALALEKPQGYTAQECMECHMSESGDSSLQISPEHWQGSVHGQTLTCMGCHTSITGEKHMEGEGVDPANCNRCHAMKAGKAGLFSKFSTFQISSHAKADFAGHYKMDNCLGCHQGVGAHGETDPINEQDCYTCHDPNLENAMWGTMHADRKNTALPIVLLYACFAVFFLLVFIRLVNPVFDKVSGKINKNRKG